MFSRHFIDLLSPYRHIQLIVLTRRVKLIFIQRKEGRKEGKEGGRKEGRKGRRKERREEVRK